MGCRELLCRHDAYQAMRYLYRESCMLTEIRWISVQRQFVDRIEGLRESVLSWVSLVVEEEIPTRYGYGGQSPRWQCRSDVAEV